MIEENSENTDTKKIGNFYTILHVYEAKTPSSQRIFKFIFRVFGKISEVFLSFVQKLELKTGFFNFLILFSAQFNSIE